MPTIPRYALKGTDLYHPDHLGSTTVVSRQDGSLEERISYKPFGEPRQVSDEVFQFTSQEYSSDLGIYDYGARQYNPVLRRFIQPDTLISDCYNPQILNRYSYVVNNPLKYTDPTGNVLITVDFLSLSYTTEYGGGNLDAKTESFGIVLDIDSKPGFAFYSKEGSGESSFDLSLSANVGISEGDTVTDIGGKSYEEQTNLGGLSITEGYDKPPNERLIFPLKDKSQSTSYGVGPGINRIASFSLYETNTHVLVVFSFDSDKQGGTEK